MTRTAHVSGVLHVAAVYKDQEFKVNNALDMNVNVTEFVNITLRAIALWHNATTHPSPCDPRPPRIMITLSTYVV